jgi:hypothetical protein
MNCRLASLFFFTSLIVSTQRPGKAQIEDEKSLYELSLDTYDQPVFSWPCP